MAARSDGDVAWELKRDATGFAGECFDEDGGTAVSSRKVEVKETQAACDAFARPDADHGADIRQGWQFGDFQMDVYAGDSKECQGLMEVQKGLVKGVSNG